MFSLWTWCLMFCLKRAPVLHVCICVATEVRFCLCGTVLFINKVHCHPWFRPGSSIEVMVRRLNGFLQQEVTVRHCPWRMGLKSHLVLTRNSQSSVWHVFSSFPGCWLKARILSAWLGHRRCEIWSKLSHQISLWVLEQITLVLCLSLPIWKRADALDDS